MHNEMHVFSSGEHSSIKPAHPRLGLVNALNKDSFCVGAELHFPFSQYPEQQSAVVVHAELEHAHLESKHGAPQQSADDEHTEPLRQLS
ncbi:MAG: hypothetical protein QXF07_02140, partial [Candidatus Micrarchaeia archaeon]